MRRQTIANRMNESLSTTRSCLSQTGAGCWSSFFEQDFCTTVVCPGVVPTEERVVAGFINEKPSLLSCGLAPWPLRTRGQAGARGVQEMRGLSESTLKMFDLICPGGH
jgi:hypothetical protein